MSSTQQAAAAAGTLTTGDGRNINVKEIAELYRDVFGLSVPNCGRINCLGKENYGITCGFSVTDCDELEKVKTSRSYSLVISTNSSAGKSIESTCRVSQSQLMSEVALVTSENGQFLARLKEANGKQRQLLEIWNCSKLMKTFNVGDIEEHGLINKDCHFASMQWSPFGEQDKLLYVCQAKKPKYKSFFKQQVDLNAPGERKQEEKEGLLLNCGDNNIKCEDWGEQLVGIEHTIVAILDVKTMKISTISVENYSLSSTLWLDDGKRIVSVAYSERPRRLGPIYCNNKPSKLIVHELDDDKSCLDITIEGQSLHSARVSHCGKKIVYLSNPTFGAHQHAVSINLYDLTTNTNQMLAEELFIIKLPERCFSLDDKQFLFVKEDHLHNQMFVINLETKLIKQLEFPLLGLGILDFYHNIILAKGAEINKSPSLYVAILPSCTGKVSWHLLDSGVHSNEVDYETYKINTLDNSTFISAILVSPNLEILSSKNDETSSQVNLSELPTVIYIHGGPHSSFVVDYMHMPVLFARLGLKTLLINYRGSLGVDEDYVKSLCGKIGTLDVGDCLHIIRHFVSSKTIDSNKLIVFGGSHSGFIACHLCCQKEFKFTSAVIRNPVVDLIANFSATDIPEWIFTEGLGYENFDYTRKLNKEELVKLYECSPDPSRAENVPTLMMLGSLDRRVPMFQGERWVDHLKARGIEAKCKIYEDFHDLAKPETAVDSAITAIIWILQHLNNN